MYDSFHSNRKLCANNGRRTNHNSTASSEFSCLSVVHPGTKHAIRDLPLILSQPRPAVEIPLRLASRSSPPWRASLTPTYDFFNRDKNSGQEILSHCNLSHIKFSNRDKFSQFFIRFLPAPMDSCMPLVLRVLAHRVHPACPQSPLTGIVSPMRIAVAEEKDSAAWDAFVAGHARCVNYHRWPWKRLIEQAFGWKTFYMFAEENSKISGILPLVWLKSRLFGNLICSLPFFSEAGLLADSP